ncbi:hypothetical protein [Nocardia sp. CA-135398]|uniref:hypothetical protein n=1 Tax=Nocardia sp. CA-135398 TaxID=3239977 RepID=UPI003D9878AB
MVLSAGASIDAMLSLADSNPRDWPPHLRPFHRWDWGEVASPDDIDPRQLPWYELMIRVAEHFWHWRWAQLGRPLRWSTPEPDTAVLLERLLGHSDKPWSSAGFDVGLDLVSRTDMGHVVVWVESLTPEREVELHAAGHVEPRGFLVFDSVRAALDCERLSSHLRRAVSGWLPDDVDPAQPLRVVGLEDHLPSDYYRCRYSLIHALDQLRALLLHRHLCASEPPGRLFVARRRLTRGPNVRRLAQLSCQPAGLVRV